MHAASRRPGLSRNSPHVSSCATAAAGRSAAWMCLSLHPAVMRPRSWIIIRRRCRGVNAASLAGSGDISTSMSGYWLALVCRQCWCCEAHGCNCSAKNQPCDFCHVRPLRVGKQDDALLSTRRRLDCVGANAITLSRGAADRGAHRQAAGAIAQDVKSSAESCEIPALYDQQRRKQ